MILFTDRKSYPVDILVALPQILRLKTIFECDDEKYTDFCTVKSVVLREKDLNDDEYIALARNIFDITADCGVDLYVRSADAAAACGTPFVHCAYKDFVSRGTYFDNSLNYSVSVHSVSEAIDSVQKGADRLVTGHIFATDCKKGLPPRGVDYLKDVIKAVSIPVAAIGGIKPDNYKIIADCGAADIAVMSYLNNLIV